MRTALVTIAAISAVTLQPRPAAGQVGGPNPGQLRKACDMMRRVLVEGSMVKPRDWALRIAASGGRDGGEALAHALRDYRRNAENNPALERVVSATTALRDRSIDAEAAEIAADRSASAPIRVQAIRVMYLQLNPGRLDTYESFPAGDQRGSGIGSEGPAVGEELAPDAVSRAAALAQSVLDDTTAPSQVRAAAEKPGRSARVQLVCPSSVSLDECSRRLRKKG